jgi:hypothetical protein
MAGLADVMQAMAKPTKVQVKKKAQSGQTVAATNAASARRADSISGRKRN